VLTWGDAKEANVSETEPKGVADEEHVPHEETDSESESSNSSDIKKKR